MENTTYKGMDEVSASLLDTRRASDQDELNDRIDDLLKPPPAMATNQPGGIMPMTNARMSTMKLGNGDDVTSPTGQLTGSSLSQKLFGIRPSAANLRGVSTNSLENKMKRPKITLGPLSVNPDGTIQLSETQLNVGSLFLYLTFRMFKRFSPSPPLREQQMISRN
jgi:hypothetical protein